MTVPPRSAPAGPLRAARTRRAAGSAGSAPGSRPQPPLYLQPRGRGELMGLSEDQGRPRRKAAPSQRGQRALPPGYHPPPAREACCALQPLKRAGPRTPWGRRGWARSGLVPSTGQAAGGSGPAAQPPPAPPTRSGAQRPPRPRTAAVGANPLLGGGTAWSALRFQGAPLRTLWQGGDDALVTLILHRQNRGLACRSRAAEERPQRTHRRRAARAVSPGAPRGGRRHPGPSSAPSRKSSDLRARSRHRHQRRATTGDSDSF